MDSTNSFDHWLDRPGVRSKTSLVDATVMARDTLQGCWYAVQSVYGKEAKPEHALMLLPIVLNRADAARQRSPDE